MEHHQLLQQAVLAFAQRIDPRTDRRHPLAEIEVEPVTVERRITPPPAASERRMRLSPHAAPQYPEACHAHRAGDSPYGRCSKAADRFGITRFYTDGWGAYERHIAPEQHHVGKDNTQRIERKPINLRTRIKRLVRRTICFSKTTTMHDLVIGLFINRYVWGNL
jgi:insertion element IS1 protein InsB